MEESSGGCFHSFINLNGFVLPLESKHKLDTFKDFTVAGGVSAISIVQGIEFASWVLKQNQNEKLSH